MKAGYALLGDQTLTEFLSEQRGNSFYGSADIALIGTLCNLAKTDDVEAALARIADEIAAICNLFGDLAVEIATRFCIEVLDIDAQAQLDHSVELEVPALADLRLPYFTDGQLHVGTETEAPE